MSKLLPESATSGEVMPIEDMCKRIALSFVAGFVVAGVYAVGIGRRKDDAATLPTTLVLLTVVITVVTLVIGNNLARAFGLVGALSIVRFRTVVEDTRDTAFVIFAVVIGMGIGAGFAKLSFLGVPAVLLAAVLMRWFWPDGTRGGGQAVLTVRIALGQEPDKLFAEVFAKHVAKSRLTATGTAKQGAALELTYRIRLRNGGTYALVAELTRIEGVQSVEVRASY